ncbi:MAG: zinc ribbon domain-containing protein [Verrucomicrobiota bacterium]|nr:zinc ribbon domain-containing protein [Verrucomicrobiota bacterium]
MKLICPECRRENEPERIYCHECGARLDRSALTKEAPKEEDSKATQKRVRAMFDGRRAKLRRQFFQGAKLVLGALLIAVIVQMVRSPDLPEAPPAAEMPPQINLDLENATMSGRAAPLQYTDGQVNAYLAYVLKGKKAALSKYLQFEEAFVGFDEGSCSITMGRSLFGWPLFTTASLVPQLQNGNLSAQVRSGSIGRLPVHPALMQFSGFLFADLRAVLDRERKLIAKLGAIECHPKAVVLIPKPRA